MLVQSGFILCQPCTIEINGGRMKCGHRCGTCHKVSDAKVRKTEIKVIIVSCKYWGMEFFLSVSYWVASGHIYRCVLPPSSRWCLLNGGIISVTSLLGFKWKDTPSTIWRLIIDFVTPCHRWQADGLVLARWFIQSWANPGVILVYRSSSILGWTYMHIFGFISCPPPP